MKHDYWKIATIVLCAMFVFGMAVSYTYARKDNHRLGGVNITAMRNLSSALKDLKKAQEDFKGIKMVTPEGKGSEDLKNTREYTGKAIESTERVLSVLKSMERKENK